MTPYDLAYEYAMHTSRCIFLTGKAGTGKTTFLRRLQRECPKQIMVCAPTGVAAINAEGVTIHSLFQLPPQLFLPTPEARRLLFQEMQMRDQKRQILRNLELLVIDEVSMVRSDLLDTIDAVLRQVRHRHQLPFGGVQLLLIGDLYQLSPVAREDEWRIMRQWYQGPYFFQARVFQELSPVYIELDHVYRQSNQQFVDILNEVRTNTLSPASLAVLNSRYMPDYRDDQSILLSTHNRKVDAINAREMEALSTRCWTYEGVVEGTFPEAMYPMDLTLNLKVGARVMFIKNDSSQDKRYYNGKLGVVSELDTDSIIVSVEGEPPIEVHQETWENIRYTSDKNSDELHTEVIGTFEHYPLRLAWAVTIHKAQGLTFDHVVIDAEDAFAAGQVYVALSRCRSLEGLTLLSPVPERALTNARDVVQFTDRQPTTEEAEQWLTGDQVAYMRQLLCSLYDLRDVYHKLERLSKLVTEAASFNEPETGDFIRSLMAEVAEQQRVAESFQRQLGGILSSIEFDYAFLEKRLGDACDYFTLHLTPLAERLMASPAYTDDKEDAKAYQTLMEEMYVDLMRQQHIMRAIRRKPSIRGYFQARRSFVIPRVKISAKGEQHRAGGEQTKHPLLLSQLQELRAQFVRETEQPAYVFAATKTLVEISNKLPTSQRELMDIKGFGKKRYALFGKHILDVVKRYVGGR